MLRLTKIRKEFGNFVAVQDLDLTIPEGEIFGLIGPNGAGKTTTIRMACGLLSPTSGTVTIAGVDVYKDPERAQQYIGYLSDVYSVYEDLKVWEYLDYFAHAYKMPEEEISPRIAEVIRLVGLDIKRDVLIKGLSRGMQQRLGIGRSILHRPLLLLLDEPASGLDPKARVELRTLLTSLRNEGTTIVVSSHILTDLEQLCTSLGMMERGRLVQSGSLETITAETKNVRSIRFRFLGSHEEAIRNTLGGLDTVTEVEVIGQECLFQYAGNDPELAEVLHRLVTSRIPIVYFEEMRRSVEDMYMKLSHHEVM